MDILVLTFIFKLLITALVPAFKKFNCLYIFKGRFYLLYLLVSNTKEKTKTIVIVYVHSCILKYFIIKFWDIIFNTGFKHLQFYLFI